MNVKEKSELAIALIERAAPEVPKFAAMLRTQSGLPDEQKYNRAMTVLEHLGELFEHAPDPQWWRDFHLLTGQHMILWEEGWEPGECKAAYLAEDPKWEPLDEINIPSPAKELANQLATRFMKNGQFEAGRRA